MVKERTVVIDNGGATCKVGFAGEKEPRKCVPNLIAKSKTERKTFIGDQLDACHDFSGLQYRMAFEKGYPINWDVQTDVWSRALGKGVLDVNSADCRLMLSVPPLCPSAILSTLDEMVFEHFNFKSACMMTAPVLAHLAQLAELEARSAPAPPACLVLDSGHSFSHAVPIFDAQGLNYAVRRVDVGGKLLTNQLKQVISHRQWNVMDETHMINDVKEKVCYVSSALGKDLAAASVRKAASNTVRREYVMPDYIHVMRGYVKHSEHDEPPPGAEGAQGAPAAAEGAPAGAAAPSAGAGAKAPPAKRPKTKEGGGRAGGGAGEEQVLALTVERFATPEILFSPSDIGLEQAGLAEAVVQAVSATLPDLHEALYNNVLLVGGNARFPGLKERLEAELRPLVPADISINVRMPEDPIIAAWRGAASFAASPLFERSSVRRDEYLEYGHSMVRRVCYN